ERRGAAVNRLEERNSSGMNVAGSCKPQSSLQRRAEVCEYVAEQVVRHNHIVLPRIKHHEHSHSINVLVIGFHIRVTRRNFPENPGINLRCFAIPERRKALGKQPYGSQVYVEVKTAPHTQQNIFGVLVRRNARVAESSCEYRVEIFS